MVLLLELARGLAALWVFFFHAKSLFETSSPIIYELSTYGSLGVPMFFVISGYVITYSAESSLRHKKSPLTFLKNRFLRIYPAFLASVVVVLCFPFIIELISSLKSGEYAMPDNLLLKYSYFEWANFLMLSKVFWATSSNLQAEFNSINAVYWTLAIEFQFYIVVYISLHFGKYYRYAIILVSLIALLGMVVPLNLNYGLFIHYWPSFSIGILLAYIHRNGYWFLSSFRTKAASLVTLFSVIALLINLLPSTSSLFFALCFGIFLWIISDFEKVLSKFKNSDNKVLYWILEPWLILGTMSYSVYLLHAKIYNLPNMFIRQILDQENILFGLLTIVGTLLICFPFYYFVERRFLSKNYQKLHKEVLTKA